MGIVARVTLSINGVGFVRIRHRHYAKSVGTREFGSTTNSIMEIPPHS